MELTIDQALERGVAAHKAGKVQEADRYYTAILKAQPAHADANHNMGVLGVGVGKVEEALPFFKKALEANPSISQYWLSYIDALIKLNRFDEARNYFDAAKQKGVNGEAWDKLEAQLSTNQFSKTPLENGMAKSLEEKLIAKEPPRKELDRLFKLFKTEKFNDVLNITGKLLQIYPNSINLHNLFGSSQYQFKKYDAHE